MMTTTLSHSWLIGLRALLGNSAAEGAEWRIKYDRSRDTTAAVMQTTDPIHLFIV